MSTVTLRTLKGSGRRLPGIGHRPRQRLWHPDVPGPLWNGRRRVAWRQIKAYCQVLAREFQPQKIILFGSYAAGSATRESDVDLVLVALLQLLLGIEPLWVSFAPALRRLNDYAVKSRYPGRVATRADARQALKTCRSLRGDVRSRLGLPRK